jgi:site-specific DNA recombinase
MKAYLIARVSTKDQKDALPAQKYRLMDYADKHFPDREFIEFQETAYSGDREIFNSITDRIFENTEIVALVFDKIDRLTRDYTDPVLRAAIALVKQGRIELHFPSENLILNTQSSANELQRLGMGAVSSQNYSDSVSYNVRRRNEQLWRDGIWTSPAPFGYVNITNGDGSKWIKLVQLEAHAVKTAYEAYATGSYSLKTVRTKIIQEYGIIRTAAQWDKILKNPFYTGIMRIKGNLFAHHYETVLSEELFEKVKAVREGYAKKPKRWGGIPYQYRGLISCAICGCRITFEKKKGKYIYGHCTQYKGKHGAVYVSEDLLTEQLRQVFNQVQLPEDAYQEVVEALATDDINAARENDEKLAHIRTQINQYETMIDRNYDTYLDGGISKEKYKLKSAELLATKQALENSGKNIELMSKSTFDDVITLLNLSRDAPSIFENAEIEEKRTMMNMVVSNLELGDEELRWKLKKPYDTMAICNETQNWLGMRDSNPRSWNQNPLPYHLANPQQFAAKNQ